MKRYNSIDELAEEQTGNYDVWSHNGEDFYDSCPEQCFRDIVAGLDYGEETSVRIVGGKLEHLTWEELVDPFDWMENVDCRYYDVFVDEDSLFSYFPRETIEKWGKEFEEMVINKFKELDLSKAPSPIVKTKEFDVMINEEDWK